MQKKLIALAVAGMVAAPLAMAQSNVTVFGVVDLGYSHVSGSDFSGAASAKNRNAIDQGHLNGSRLGFRGTEDLGNGLTAYFHYELDMRPDSGDNRATERQTFAGLRGDFGAVQLGRFYSPQFNLITSIEPTGGSNMTSTGVYSYVGAVNNTAAYVSPSFNGFNVTVAHSWAGTTVNELQNELDTTNAAGNNTRVLAISPVYRNGPLMVGLNYHTLTAKDNNAGASDSKTKTWDIGGTYDFGAVKLGVVYGRDNFNQVASAANKKATKWMLAATVPVSEAGRVALSYENRKSDARAAGASDPKASKWSLSYIHNLSARTALYASYTNISTNRAATGQHAVYGSAAGAGNGAHTRGIYTGIRHSF